MSFRCFMPDSGAHTELRTKPFIRLTGVDGSNSINLDRVQALSHSKYSLLFTCCRDWTCNYQAWFGRYISEKSWILSWYHMDYISFESFQLVFWRRGDWLRWVSGYCFLSLDPDFLKPMLCSLGSCCNEGCLFNFSFLLDMHRCYY